MGALTKLEDVQNVSVTIPNGYSGAVATVTHNLKDQHHNILTPTSIIVEPISINRTGQSTPEALWWIIQRSSPEDGTFNLAVLGSQNNNGDDTIVVFRVTSVYWHSIQADDYTV